MIRGAKFIVVGVIASLLLLAPVQARAFDIFGKACDGSPEAQSSSLCQEKDTVDPNPVYGPNGIINKVANVIAIISGVVALVYIMISGLKIVMSSGDSNKVTEARNGIIYASVGLVVIAMARIIIGFILRFV